MPTDQIPLETIKLAAASLPDPATSERWSYDADIVSQTGLACKLTFELRPFNCPDNTQWRWEAIACLAR